MSNLLFEANGKTFRKSSFCGGSQDCVGLPVSGILNAVADTKLARQGQSGAVLDVNAAGLVAFAKNLG